MREFGTMNIFQKTKLSIKSGIAVSWISYGKQFRLCVLQKVHLLHDNARPHIAKLVKEKPETFGWKIIPHPPYSPDIAPTDFHLFRSMQNLLDGKEFENDEEVKSAIFTFFASKPQSFFQNAISALVKRWHYIVDSAGEYCPDKFVE